MKSYIAPLSLIFISMIQVACGSDSKAQANQCWSSAYTSPVCQSQLAAAQAYANAQQNAVAQSEVAPKGSSLLTANTGIVNPATASQALNVTQIMSVNNGGVSDQAIKAQTLKIQSALSSYANNPESNYYDPAQPARTPASAASASDIAPAIVSPAVSAPPVAQVAAAPAAASGPADTSAGSSR